MPTQRHLLGWGNNEMLEEIRDGEDLELTSLRNFLTQSLSNSQSGHVDTMFVMRFTQTGNQNLKRATAEDVLEPFIKGIHQKDVGFS